MSERDATNPFHGVIRATIPGRPSGPRPGDAAREPVLFAPGRGNLEASVALAAIAILVPLVAVASLGFAWRARQAGNRRWLAAAIAAIWCAFLGALFRGVSGMGIAP